MAETTAREVAQKAKRILPIMGRVMEAQMRTPAVPLPPVHFHVMNALSNQPHTLSTLAERMSVSAASLSRTVTVLEERGWLTRTRSTEDRRVVMIALTGDGRDQLLDIEQRSEDFLTETLSTLSQDELDRLLDGLNILIGAFTDVMSHVPSDVSE